MSILGLVLVLGHRVFLVDLLLLGGAMTGGMMAGVGAMMGSGVGIVVLVLLISPCSSSRGSCEPAWVVD